MAGCRRALHSAKEHGDTWRWLHTSGGLCCSSLLRTIAPRVLAQAYPPLCLNPHRAKGGGEGFPLSASAYSFLDGLPVHDHHLSLREWMRTSLKLFWSYSLMTWTERFLRPSMWFLVNDASPLLFTGGPSQSILPYQIPDAEQLELL